ncbi:hypothetical protein ACJRO7_025782 [Eucalyptus globulus]|uniref:J domain-containing protein n=1 Tax=Eucalyptus globulus TaxID=34317 RepID=A0ABD3KMA0_EUCGL
MTCAAGLMGKNGSSWIQLKNNERTLMKKRMACKDEVRVLRIHRGASESEVKKAFRQLALQYHPDVCRGSNCKVHFHQINEAYETSEFYCALWVTILLANRGSFSMFLMPIVMSNLRGESNGTQMYESGDQGINEPMRGTKTPQDQPPLIKIHNFSKKIISWKRKTALGVH